MVAAAVLVLLVPRVWAQLLALLLGGLVGWCVDPHLLWSHRHPERLVVPLRRSVAVVLLGFAVLLVALPWLSAEARPLLVQQLGGFLRTGALVFGGGHVVLPLLEQALVPNGWIDLPAVSRGVWRAPRRCRGPCSVCACCLALICSQGFRASPGSVMAATPRPLHSFFGGWWALAFWSRSRAAIGSVVGPAGHRRIRWWAFCWRRCFSPSLANEGIRGGARFSWRWWRLCCW